MTRFFIIAVSFLLQQCQGQVDPGWIWLSGNSVGNQHSVLPDNRTHPPQLAYPGSRAGVATWTDEHGNVWWFGGEGYDEKPADTPHILGDLWKFSTDSLKWDLEHQTSPFKAANPANNQRFHPKARKGASLCGVTDLSLVVFGGTDDKKQPLHDTWIYDIPKSTWIPSYVLDLHSKKKRVHPDGRYNAATWCTPEYLIMFGGQTSVGNYLDDMWMYSLRDLSWSKEHQHVQIDEIPSTTLDHPFPIARSGATTWVGHNQTLYLFGGSAHKFEGDNEFLSDLWQFSHNESLWTLISGDQTTNPTNDHSGIQPGNREQATGWLFNQSYLMLFGGVGPSTQASSHQYLNDLWLFNINDNTWQDQLANASYTLPKNPFQAHLMNKARSPTARCQATAWQHNGMYYLASGFGEDQRKKLSFLNDMFILVMNPSRISPEIFFQVQHGSNTHLAPGRVFLICFSTFGGIVLVFGAVFFFKKMVDFPRHHPRRSYNVKYSPLDSDASLDMFDMS